MDAITDLPAYTVLENGYIHGTWFCGRPMAKYYGAFPQSFWPRAKQVLRPWGMMLHWFAGTVPPEPGIVTVDGNAATRPSVCAQGSSLPFVPATFDAAFADPPYSPKDSERYDTAVGDLSTDAGAIQLSSVLYQPSTGQMNLAEAGKADPHRI